MEFYSKKLENIRKTSGMSIKYITCQLNIGRSTYWNWENSKRTPSESNVRKLAKLMNIRVEDISDLSETHKSFDDELFKVVPSLYDFSGDISRKLIRQQENAIDIIRKINSELNKVWKIVMASLKAVEDIVYIKSIDNKYIAVNDSFKKHLSLKKDYNVSMKTDNDFFIIAESRANSLEDEEVMNSGKSVSDREDYIPGSKKKKWGIISKYPISDNAGNVSGLISIIRDITETRELRWMQNLLMHALNHSKDVFSIRNAKTYETVFISDSLQKEYGYSKKQFTDKKNGFSLWLDLLSPEDKAKEIKYKELNKIPSKRQYSLFINGKKVWIDLSSSTTLYDNEEYICTNVKNITEEKKATETKLSIVEKMIDKGYPKKEILEITGITNLEYINISKS